MGINYAFKCYCPVILRRTRLPKRNTRPVPATNKPVGPVSTGRTMHLNPIAASVRSTCIPALALILSSNCVYAGPEGGVVSAGEGDISIPDANTTNINQYTKNLAIDWRTFNIAVDETVQFMQPSSSATALNRIHDQSPSQIFGSIIANGNVILLNASGVFFSPTASVNVNSLVASSLNISNDDFLAGNLTFQAPPGQDGGMVVNQGVIEAATGGSVTLMGGAVSNEGVILAHAGQVNLVAGNQVTLDFDGDGLMQFTINKEVFSNARNLDSAVKNTGTIDATGGTVLMAGSAAAEVFSNVVNNEGMIKAGRIDNEGGVIRLVATGSGASVINTGTLNADAADSTSDGGTIEMTGTNVTQAGTVSANSTGGNGGQITLQSTDTTLVTGNAIISATSSLPSPLTGEGTSSTPSPLAGEGGGEGGGVGGTVHVLGDKVGLLDLASIDVSGALGGGEVLIGGDFQGKNPEIQNASMTYVGSETSINADATMDGDGGKVIVWSDEYTKYFGNISARGGDNGGDGGFVEVSGKQHLTFSGFVDTRAPLGEAGTLLLDPTNMTINNTADTNVTGATPFEPATASGSILTWATLDTAVDTSNVLVTTNSGFDAGEDGDITIGDTGNISSTGGFDLEFDAADDIIVDAAVTYGGGGDLLFTAADEVVVNAVVATGNMTGNGDQTSGSIIIDALGLVTLNAGLLTGLADSDDNNDATSGSIDITGVGITTIAGGTITTGNAVSDGDAGEFATSGSITLDAVTGAVTLGAAITTGTATTTDDAETLTTGDIDISTDLGITGDAAAVIATGTASTAGGGGGINVTVTSGAITLDAGGAVTLAAANALTTGDATATAANNAANDDEISGNIIITNSEKTSSDGNNLPVDIQLGTASGGTATVTQGVLEVSTDGAGGDAGGIFITSDSALRVGALLTDGGDSQNVSVSTTGGAALTINDAVGNLDDDVVTLDSDTGTLTIADTSFDIGTGSLTLIGDEIDLMGGANSVKGTGGTVFLRPSDDTTSIGVGGGAGTLEISDTDLLALQDGFTSITIGSATGMHAINIGSSTFTDPVTIRTPNGGSIAVTGLLSGTSDASITLDGSGATTTLIADITTEGDFILISDNVILAANLVTLDTTSGGNAAGADVTITGTINADDSTTNDRALVITAGTSGDVTFSGNVGTGANGELADLDVTAEFINLNAANYVINGQGGNDVTFDGAVVLGTDVSISTNGTSDNNITFMSTVDSASGTTKDLTIDLDTGDLVFQDDVGTTDSLDAFTITDAHNVTIEKQFIANSFTQTTGSGASPTTIIGGTAVTGNGGDMTITNDININTAFITIQDNVTSTTGDIRFSVTDNVTVTVTDLAGDAVDPTAGADVDPGEDGAVVRDVEATNGIVFIIGDGSATLLLQDQCLAGDCTIADGSASIPSDRLISRLIAGDAVVINPANITITIETNVDNTSWPQIVNQAAILDCGMVDCFLGDDSGTPTFTDAAIFIAFGSTDFLFITQTTDVNIILDLDTVTNGALFADKTIFISSEGDIFDNSTGLAYQGAGLGLTTTGGAIGDDSDGVATPDGSLTIDVTSFTATATGGNDDTAGNDVDVENDASAGDAVYNISTDGPGDIVVQQFNNNLLIGGTGITTDTGLVALVNFSGNIDLDPLATTGVVTGDQLLLLADTGIGDANPIATSVNTLSALNATSGDININNTGTALTLDDWSGLNALFAGTAIAVINQSLNPLDGVTITNDMSIDIPGTNGDGILAEGDVSLTADGATSDITARGFITAFQSFSGNITLSAGQDVILGDGTGWADTIADGDIIVTAGRDVTLANDTFFSAGNVADITATTGSINLNDTSSIDATELVMFAGVDIAQAAGTEVTVVDSTELEADTGFIALGETINDFGGDVSAKAATDITLGDANSISVEEIDAGGNVILTALTGAITDADTVDDSVANIIATDLTLTATAVGGSFATAGNDLDVTVTGELNVDVSSGAAGTRSVFIESTGDLALGQIATEDNTVPTLPTGTGDDVKLVVNGALTDADTGNDSLTIGAGSYGDINIIADNITIVADSVGATGTGDIDILMATVTNQGLNIDTSAAPGDVFLESLNNMLVTLIDAGNGNVSLSATGSVSVPNPFIADSSLDITDVTVSVIASGLIATAPGTIFFVTDITSLDASTTGTGFIVITETDATTADGLVLTGALSTQGGGIILDVAGTLDDQGNTIETMGTGAGGAVSITTTGSSSDIILSGGIDTSGANGGADQNGFNAGAVTINAGGIVTISNTITATGGDANDVTTDAVPKTGGAGGTVTITANNGGVSVDAIDTSGGDGDTAEVTVGVGGVAGGISITSTIAADVDLNANLTAVGGLNTNATSAAGGAVSIISDNTINFINPITIDAGTGSISLRVDNSNAQTVTLDLANGTFNASAITFTGGTDADDTLVPHDLTNAWTITGVNDGTLSNSKITGTAAAQFIDFNITGGTAADTFTFTTTGSLTGSLDGGGGADTLVGDNDGNVFTITGPDSGTMTSITGGWSDIDNLKGGTSTDTFNITTGTLSGDIDGSTGLDTLSYAGGPAATVTITGGGSLDGAQGSATDVTGGFDNIDNFIGSADIDTFTVDGAFTGNIDGADGGDTFDINAVMTGNLAGNFTGVDPTDVNIFNINAGGDVTGTVLITSTETTTGDFLDFENSISGGVNVQGNATWIWDPVGNNQEPLSTLGVGGTGNLMVPVTGNVDVYNFFSPYLDPATPDLNLFGFENFNGHLVVGGTIDPITSTIAGTDFIDITAETLAINAGGCGGLGVCTSGNLTFLAENIVINGNFENVATTQNNQLTLIAIDDDDDGDDGVGTISSPLGPTGLIAGQIFLIAEGEILDSTNVNVFGGTVEVATGAGPATITFGPFSTSVPGSSTDFDQLLNLVNTQFGQNISQVNFTTLTTLIQILEQLGYIDTGLFEQDLDLFGVIGTGIALALAQCEEVEGCAPNVTEEELVAIIAQIQQAIAQLKRLQEEGVEETFSEQFVIGDEKVQKLIELYEAALQQFTTYLDELQQYLTGGQEEEQAVPDEFGGEAPSLATRIESLAKVLEGIKARITWLESLKGDPESRAKLTEKTGIELTQEALDALIEGAKAEAQSIEQQIKLLQEGTEASVHDGSLFVAEAGDYSRIYNVNYGPSLLNLAESVAMESRLY